MRIPYIASVPLALITVAAVWWYGTRSVDFLTPPAGFEIASDRQPAQSADPSTHSSDLESNQPIKVKPNRLLQPDELVEIETKDSLSIKPEDLGELSVSPDLDCYIPLAEKGAAYLTEIATTLEVRGEIQRAMLAWERVLDATPADPSQKETARLAIERLRPQVPIWSVDPLMTKSVTLHISCDQNRATDIEPTLVEIVDLLENAGSGLIEVKWQLQAGAKPAAQSPRQPLALSFTGSSSNGVSSKTLSMPLETESVAELKSILLSQIYKLIGDGIQQIPSMQPLIHDSQVPSEKLILSAISRRAWSEWVNSLHGKNL